MASLCEGADCFGLPTSLDGDLCLTQIVECKDGVLVVRSQGTRTVRFSAGGGADFSAIPAFPDRHADLVPGTVDFNGPYQYGTDGSTPLLTVAITNPFCSVAAANFEFEFGTLFETSDRDAYEFNGNVNIQGVLGFTDNTFDPATGLISTNLFPAYQVGLDTISGVALPADDLVLLRNVHGKYSAYAEIPAGGVVTVQALANLQMVIRGPGRTVRSSNVAMLCSLSPLL